MRNWLIKILGGVGKEREKELQELLLRINKNFREKCDECLNLAYEKEELIDKVSDLTDKLEKASKNDHRAKDGKFAKAPKKKGEKDV